MSSEHRMMRAMANQRIAQQNAMVARETSPERTYRPTEGGDRFTLRGIPVIGPVTGAILGSIPHVDGARR